MTPKSKDQSGFDPAGVKSLLNVDERDKGVLVTAEAQGIHKAAGHSVPTETALGRLKNYEGAGCERNGAVRIKRSRVTIGVDDRDDEAGLPSGRKESRR